MEKRTIAEIIGILGLIIFGGMAIVDEKVYYCEANKLAMNCDSLSKYYNLPNGKCLNSEYGNKLCKSGWESLNALAVVEKETASKNQINLNANGGTFSCEITDDKYINSYTKCKKENGMEGYLGELI